MKRGKQYEKHPNGEIKISIKAYIQNLEKVCVTRERMKQLDDELFPVSCDSTPMEARTGPSARLDQRK